jgi:hypothetical protein
MIKALQESPGSRIGAGEGVTLGSPPEESLSSSVELIGREIQIRSRNDFETGKSATEAAIKIRCRNSSDTSESGNSKSVARTVRQRRNGT